ncbi:ferrous iron transport protein B [Endomicrobium proavitum]|uniref:Ferrous iron transport protein B n=1 Tax=Endomicrobium proavitum TaxID=1408281 RepID=A0A0G3WJ49_9BACT|nr:ferrous iron transport protein B [Endomicrobium proavitum]AKL98353.1 Ferrous iron transport protein B [Endomicrobium proavitum]
MSKRKKITVALAGNPNCGKTTIFNSLTGSNQHVGNYPGVTVEKKEGVKKYKDYEIKFVDLPGTYSLSAYSDDEVVARDFIINDKPDVVVHVVDASNMDRNLYLFTQLAELDIPVMIALNMVDILETKGYKTDEKELSNLLGIPVLPTVGNKKKGIKELIESIINNYESGAFQNQKVARVDYGDDIKTETDILEALIAKDKSLSKLPKNWLSIKLLDSDSEAVKKVSKAANAKAILSQTEKSRRHLEEHFGETAETKIAEYRYGFTNSVVKRVVKEKATKKKDYTSAIDKIVLNRVLGLPIFAAVMFIIFWFTFTFSAPVVGWFESFFEWLAVAAGGVIPEGPLQSLVVDGIIGGVGGLLGFFPLVLFMFFAIAFFEDTGYMARAAFVMDKVMSKFGLHGKSFLPMMIATNGCAVPGIMATRTLDSKRDRLITMFVTPFMICGAKLPIFLLFIGAFFAEKYQAYVMFIFYALSVCIALIAAKILSKTVLKGEPAHFVMELPPYHLPTIKGLFLKMWERGWLYVRKAGTIVVLLTIIIWAGFAYPKTDVAEGVGEEDAAAVQIENSALGKLGKIIEPLVKPIGMDGNRAIALIAGLAAKEVVVSTLGTIYSLGEVDPEDAGPLKEKIAEDKGWSPLKAMTFLIFCLIYVPCIVAVVVFFKETGSSYKWLALLVVGNTVLAWIASFIVFQAGTLLKIGIGG